MKTPYYHYDLKLLGATLDAMGEAVHADDPFVVHYAIKACYNDAVCRMIASRGYGADCVSEGEIKHCLEVGFKPENIVFAGVGKTDEGIDYAINQGIGCFNVENVPELEVINERAGLLGKTVNVALRINPDVDAHTHEKITTGLNENKFGIAMEDMVSAIRKAEKLEHVNYIGLHFHIGSQVLDVSLFAPLCERINELQDMLDGEGIKTTYINVGGGLGIDYEDPNGHPIPDFEGYFSVFRNGLKLRAGQKVHFELGRAVVGQCGTLYSKVLYVKQGHEKKFVILDAGFTDLVRVAMYGSYHYIENTTPHSTTLEPYDVVGPICESSDVFAEGRMLPATERGDIYAIRSAGAYGHVMASTYNYRDLPGEVAE